MRMPKRRGAGASVTVGSVGAESRYVPVGGSAGLADAGAANAAAAAGAADAGAADARAAGGCLADVGPAGPGSADVASTAACSCRQTRHPLGPSARPCCSQRARISELTSPRPLEPRAEDTSAVTASLGVPFSLLRARLRLETPCARVGDEVMRAQTRRRSARERLVGLESAPEAGGARGWRGRGTALAGRLGRAVVGELSRG